MEENATIEELRAECARLKVELQRKHNTEFLYVTDSGLRYVMDRVRDDSEKKAIRDKWIVIDDEDEYSGQMMCGNIRVVFENFEARLVDGMEGYGRDQTVIPSFRQISSALALYRTISLFECGLNAKVVDFYKTNWEVYVKHKKTGVVLGLGEWKGAFQIFTPYAKLPINPEYKHDAEELLSLLVSLTLSIGYDGTVAGTVA